MKLFVDEGLVEVLIDVALYHVALVDHLLVLVDGGQKLGILNQYDALVVLSVCVGEYHLACLRVALAAAVEGVDLIVMVYVVALLLDRPSGSREAYESAHE